MNFFFGSIWTKLTVFSRNQHYFLPSVGFDSKRIIWHPKIWTLADLFPENICYRAPVPSYSEKIILRPRLLFVGSYFSHLRIISVFNAVIRLCVTSIYPYLKKVLNLPASSVTKAHVENSKRWATAKNVVRSYIGDLVKVIFCIPSWWSYTLWNFHFS